MRSRIQQKKNTNDTSNTEINNNNDKQNICWSNTLATDSRGIIRESKEKDQYEFFSFFSGQHTPFVKIVMIR